jgi:hypothetical protein
MRLLRLPILALALAVGTAFTAAPASAAPPTATAGITQAVTGTVAGLGTFNGTVTVTRFVNQNGQLTAVGTVSGVITNAAGQVVQIITNAAFTAAAAPAAASCRILDLTLGPLHLDLLGLVIDLNQVHLTITAVPGPGNLLGNLLCAVAHLLDSNAATTALANLLNQILAVLQGL